MDNVTAPSPSQMLIFSGASQVCATLPVHIPLQIPTLHFTSRWQQRRIGIRATKKDLFPGGMRRASVKLPSLGIKINSEIVLGNDSNRMKCMLESGIKAGVNVVVLEAETEESLRLYDAARSIMAMLRGRADLLIVERVDIAAAVAANGVVLSDTGLPSVVARRMLQNAMPDAVVFPLVARRVATATSAESATMAEGADLLILKTSTAADAQSIISSLSKRVSIPILVESTFSWENFPVQARSLLQAGAAGFLLKELPTTDPTELSNYLATVFSSFTNLGKGMPNQHSVIEGLESLEQQAKLIMEEERLVLTSAVEFIREAAPEMEEISLLVEAVKALDELFLLVVVGEFNSGKSSVINALLGNEYLKQGVLPTTNEITLLRYFGDGQVGDANGDGQERHPDGHLMRYLPAELLKQMNLVDTPGTNVILQRQQRLTEEFVPRADLVLFVVGAERPLSESEASFLRYIRKWDKKIIFALNKCDLLSSAYEVGQVKKFVKENVRQLLSLEEVAVYPVSARKALRAKLSATKPDGKIDFEVLGRDNLWSTSGFEDLEQYVLNFLGGSSDAGAERLRLKLDTPLGIACALLSSCDSRLRIDAARLEDDVAVLAEMQQQLDGYKKSMSSIALQQMQRIVSIVNEATERASNYIDERVQVSNIGVVSKYLVPISSEKTSSFTSTSYSAFEREVIGTSYSEVRDVLQEHRMWIASNNAFQLRNFQEFGRKRWPSLTRQAEEEEEDDDDVALKTTTLSSLSVLEAFDVNAASFLLEQEMREVVLGTVGRVSIAGASASFLTSVLPTTLEDVIALGICSAGGLVSILRLPSRRREVKKKMKRISESLVEKIRNAIEAEVDEASYKIETATEELKRPYQSAVLGELNRVIKLQERLSILFTQLLSLRERLQNL